MQVEGMTVMYKDAVVGKAEFTDEDNIILVLDKDLSAELKTVIEYGLLKNFSIAPTYDNAVEVHKVALQNGDIYRYCNG